MEKLRKAIYLLLCVITVVVMLASILSAFRDTPNQYLKMLDFPRIQFFILSLVTLLLFVIMTKRWRWYDYALILGLLGGLAINGRYLINYTVSVKKTVPTVKGNYTDEDRFSVLLTNVLMKNRNADAVLRAIREKDADIVVAMEVDDWWEDQLSAIEDQYPYQQKQINEVAYGMALYSKLPLKEVQVNKLNNEKVPSFEAITTLRNGREIVLHTVHPVPPPNFEDYPDNKGQEEVALEKVGQKVSSSELPSVIVGDLNDVVWGFTNELTHTDSLLFDVRTGRGFFNSFDATSWWMRWPLDHVFVTEQFELARLERLSSVGSDHYPMYVELVLKH